MLVIDKMKFKWYSMVKLGKLGVFGERFNEEG